MDSVILGERIAALRKKKGYTQAQLAEFLSISSKTVSRWETGEGFPEISIFPHLSKVLDVSIDSLLNDEDNIAWTSKTFDEICSNPPSNFIEKILPALNFILIFQLGMLLIGLLEFYIPYNNLSQVSLHLITGLLRLPLAILLIVLAYKHSVRSKDIASKLPLLMVSSYILFWIAKRFVLIFYTQSAYNPPIEVFDVFAILYPVMECLFIIVCILFILNLCTSKKELLYCSFIIITTCALTVVLLLYNTSNVSDVHILNIYTFSIIVGLNIVSRNKKTE